MALLAEQVLRKGDKAVVWCLYPIMQKLIVALLAGFGIPARAFLASLNPAQRTEVVRSFNSSDSEPLRVLVCNYSCSPARYNMQHANRNVHLFDPAPCESAKLQAIGRTHRI
jgi:SNF2 family DNA or RNA helicase